MATHACVFISFAGLLIGLRRAGLACCFSWGGFATRRVRCRAGTDVRAPCAPSSCELSAWSLAVLVQRVANTPIDCIPSSLTCKWMRVLVVHIVRWILRGSLIIEVWCTPFDEQARVLHRQSVTAVRLYAVEL